MSEAAAAPPLQMRAIGVQDPTGSSVGFGYPIFSDERSRHFVQLCNGRGRIIGFEEITVDSGELLRASTGLVRRVGDSSVFGFIFSPQDVLIAERSILADS